MMAFPTDFPNSAVGTLLNVKQQDSAHIALAAYDLVGYALHLYFGDPAYLAGLDFETLNGLAESADVAIKVEARVKELRAGGLPMWLVVIKLIKEFGPAIAGLVEKIREHLNRS